MQEIIFKTTLWLALRPLQCHLILTEKWDPRNTGMVIMFKILTCGETTGYCALLVMLDSNFASVCVPYYTEEGSALIMSSKALKCADFCHVTYAFWFWHFSSRISFAATHKSGLAWNAIRQMCIHSKWGLNFITTWPQNNKAVAN